eukprot:TRINITY_DN66558_c9_g8_i1.p1 TRINITY_DN66558_c9_g8~~TRINITY_DN66558_c9_g8_i1.p1  ORF type:complete len:752 (-),score=408.00 TRINITY_DN66558_c9_g8_i1:838-2829(-)
MDALQAGVDELEKEHDDGSSGEESTASESAAESTASESAAQSQEHEASSDEESSGMTPEQEMSLPGVEIKPKSHGHKVQADTTESYHTPDLTAAAGMVKVDAPGGSKEQEAESVGKAPKSSWEESSEEGSSSGSSSGSASEYSGSVVDESEKDEDDEEEEYGSSIEYGSESAGGSASAESSKMMTASELEELKQENAAKAKEAEEDSEATSGAQQQPKKSAGGHAKEFTTHQTHKASVVKPAVMNQSPIMVKKGNAEKSTVLSLFWTAKGDGSLRSSRLDGTNEKKITDGFADPVGLAVDSGAQVAYVADAGRKHIVQVHLDGGKQEPFKPASHIGHPVALAFDQTASTLYVGESDGHVWSCASADGKCHELVFNASHSAALKSHEFSAIALHKQWLYVAGDKAIVRMNKADGHQARTIADLSDEKKHAKAHKIVVNEHDQLVYFTNEDGVYSVGLHGGDVHMIVHEPTAQARGLAVDPAHNQLFWAADKDNHIRRAHLGKDDFSDVIKAQNPHALDIASVAASKDDEQHKDGDAAKPGSSSGSGNGAGALKKAKVVEREGVCHSPPCTQEQVYKKKAAASGAEESSSTGPSDFTKPELHASGEDCPCGHVTPAGTCHCKSAPQHVKPEYHEGDEQAEPEYHQEKVVMEDDDKPVRGEAKYIV